MKKIASVFIGILLAAAGVFSCCAEEINENGIYYEIRDGAAAVIGYDESRSKLDIPEKAGGYTVKYIAEQAFRSVSGLTEVTVPGTVVSLGEYAFAECPNLMKVKFADGCTAVGYSAFRDCGALVSVLLPDTLEKIDDFAFSGCSILGKTKIPASVNEFGIDVFTGCENLRLSVGKNKAAADYAARYSIPTSFTDSWGFTLLMLVLVCAVLSAAVFAVSRRIKRK